VAPFTYFHITQSRASIWHHPYAATFHFFIAFHVSLHEWMACGKFLFINGVICETQGNSLSMGGICERGEGKGS
jgi:hypothetical protein